MPEKEKSPGQYYDVVDVEDETNGRRSIPDPFEQWTYVMPNRYASSSKVSVAEGNGSEIFGRIKCLHLLAQSYFQKVTRNPATQ